MAIDYDGIIPPLTAEEVKDRLKNKTGWAAYVFIGPEDESDLGWEAALLVYNSSAKVLLYRVDDPALVAEWTDGKKPRGIALGPGGKKSILLNKSQAEDLVVLAGALAEVRRS